MNTASTVAQSTFNTINGNIARSVLSAWDGVTGSVSGLWGRLRTSISSSFTGLWSRTQSAISSAWTVVTTSISTAMKAVGQAVMVGVRALITSPYGIAALVAGGIVAGAGIATAVARLFRLIGTALVNIGSTVLNLLTSAWGVVTSVFSRVLRLAGTGFEIVRSAIGNLWTGIRGFIASALRGGGGLSIGGVFATLFTGLKALALNVFAVVSGLLQMGVAAAAVSVFAKAATEAAKSAMEFARSAQTLRAGSGLGLGQSADVLRRFGGLGVGAGTVQGAFGGQPAGLSRMMSGAFGLPGFDERSFIPQLANKIQGLMARGLGGQMMARAIMSGLGMDSPEFLNMVMLPLNKIRAQMAYMDKLQSSLGLNGDALRKFAEDMPLAMARLGAVWDAIQMKLAGAAVPVLEKVLSVVTNLAAINADQIGAVIQTAVEWIAIQAPRLFTNGLVSVMGVVRTVIVTLDDFAHAVPAMMTGLGQRIAEWMHGFADIIRRGATFTATAITYIRTGIANGLVAVTDTITRWVDGLGDAMAALSGQDNPVRQFVVSLAASVDYMNQLFGAIIAGFTVFWESFKVGMSPLLKGIFSAAGIDLGPNLNARQISAAAMAAKAPFDSDFAGRVGQFFDDLGPMVPRLHKTMENWRNAVQSSAESIRNNNVIERSLRAGADTFSRVFDRNANAASGLISGAGQAIGSAVSPYLDIARNKADLGMAISNGLQSQAAQPGSMFELGKKIDDTNKRLDDLTQEVRTGNRNTERTADGINGFENRTAQRAAQGLVNATAAALLRTS